MSRQQKPKTDQELKEKLEGLEFFVKDDGNICAVLPYFAPDHIRPLFNWADEGEGMVELLTEQFQKRMWPVCGEPINSDDPELFDDVEKFIRDHVHFTDERLYESAASWTLSTWIKESLRIAPRPIFYGTTASGKSRAIGTLKEIVYRGYAPTIPTPAVLYALIEHFGLTIFIDEYQAIQNPENLANIEAVFKSGYEKGGTVPRMNPNTMEPIIHHVYGFMGLGTKGKLPPEDLVNRAIIFNMQQKPRGSSIVRRIDEDRARKLRGRLLAFRLKVILGEISLDEFKEKAVIEALKPIVRGGRSVELGDRPIDLAETLLVPPMFFDRPNQILEVIVKCQDESKDELLNTMEGRVFYALQICYETCPKLKSTNLAGVAIRDIGKLTTLDVADQLNNDFINQEGRDTYTKKERIETHTVTQWLKTLGFTFRRGTGNKSFFLLESFGPTYITNLEKYGVREGCPDLRERQLSIAG